VVVVVSVVEGSVIVVTAPRDPGAARTAALNKPASRQTNAAKQNRTPRLIRAAV
jgi:hypothetical protein